MRKDRKEINLKRRDYDKLPLGWIPKSEKYTELIHLF